MKEVTAKIKGFIAYDLGVLKNRFYWKTKKYLGKYYKKDNIITTTPDKTLIYMLDGRAYSGGISDILRGILSMYKFSKEIGFNFKINFCFPYNLQDYLEPNLYNWNIPQKEISYNSNLSIPLWIYSSYLNYGRSLEFEIKYQKEILQDFIQKNHTKKQFHIYTNSNWVHGEEYSLLFNELFKPAKPLKEVLNNYCNNLGAEFVSMTFRFIQLLGDFVDKDPKFDKTKEVLFHLENFYKIKGDVFPNFGELQLRVILGDYKNMKISSPLNESDKKNLVIKCINKIIELHSNCFSGVKILITADSEIFLKEVSKLNFVYAISSKDVVVVENEIPFYNIYLKAFVDVLLLAEAHKLHLLYTNEMYRSGFAKNASFINNKPYQEINF